MAKVSIIIPTYNVEQYLVECMDTVTHQTLNDIEIICINDGSTDGSLAILKEYAAKDSRIILVDKENGGYGIGMNIGLDRATGEYIGIVEPDDHVPVNMYANLYKIAKENDLDFVKADFYRFKQNPENGDMQMVYNHLSKHPEDYNHVFDPSHTPRAMKYIMNTWSGIYRRSFLEKHHIRHHETPGASFQDNGFWFQTFIYAKRAMILNTPYYLNRRDNPNSSVSNPQKVYCMNVEYDYIRDILMKDPELWERFRPMYWYKKFHNYMGTLGRIADEFKWEYVKRFSAEFKRGKEKNELDASVFTATSWKRIELVISDPKCFYNTVVLPNKRERKLMRELDKLQIQYDKLSEKLVKEKKRNARLEKKFSDICGSVSYKIGRAITAIPRAIRDMFRKK